MVIAGCLGLSERELFALKIFTVKRKKGSLKYLAKLTGEHE